MSLFINGYDAPKFVIRLQSDDSFVESFELDLPNIGGLIEDYAYPGNITHEFVDYSEEVLPRKSKITYSMDYSNVTQSDNSMKINSIMNYWEITENNERVYKIILYPYKDNPYRFSEVLYTGDSFQWTTGIGAGNRSHDKIINWKWKTKELVDRNWMNVDTSNQIIAYNQFSRRVAVI